MYRSMRIIFFIKKKKSMRIIYTFSVVICLMFFVCVSVFLTKISCKISTVTALDVPFEQNFDIVYGADRTQLLNQSTEIRISIDKYSGSGFRSRQKYASGLFHMRLKLPQKDSTGLITTFYIISDNSSTRDEVDFEFLGNNTRPYILHTNVIVNGNLKRAQGIQLWFDPTACFHDYKLLWNRHQIVFYVDEIPVRVFKNLEKINGVPFPTKPMHIECTIWNGTWASKDRPVDWSGEPFEASYQRFEVDGCSSTNPQQCYTSQYYWNQKEHWELNALQKIAHTFVTNYRLAYDYCDETVPQPPECKFNRYI